MSAAGKMLHTGNFVRTQTLKNQREHCIAKIQYSSKGNGLSLGGGSNHQKAWCCITEAHAKGTATSPQAEEQRYLWPGKHEVSHKYLGSFL